MSIARAKLDGVKDFNLSAPLVVTLDDGRSVKPTKWQPTVEIDGDMAVVRVLIEGWMMQETADGQ